jgi:hypothetical protein
MTEVLVFDHVNGRAVHYANAEEASQHFLAENLRLREALAAAQKALYDARCGLDLGLGCAREIEGDHGPRATQPRSAMQERHLEAARAAHRAITTALKQGLSTATDESQEPTEEGRR